MVKLLCRLAPAVAAVLFAAAARADLGPGGETAVDLELVLAVDISSSVDEGEYTLQMKGLADAFRHPAIHDAIEIAGNRGIAVALVQWSSWPSQHLSVGWSHLRGPADAIAFADRIERAERHSAGGSTSLGGAIRFAARQFEINQFEAPRRTIDISGDGSSNQGAEPAPLRDLVVARGVVINGLAILNDEGQLDRYYERYVIGGNAAFVSIAIDYLDFAEAILQKLIREIAGPPIASAPAEAITQSALKAPRTAPAARARSAPSPAR